MNDQINTIVFEHASGTQEFARAECVFIRNNFLYNCKEVKTCIPRLVFT